MQVDDDTFVRSTFREEFPPPEPALVLAPRATRSSAGWQVPPESPLPEALLPEAPLLAPPLTLPVVVVAAWVADATGDGVLDAPLDGVAAGALDADAGADAEVPVPAEEQPATPSPAATTPNATAAEMRNRIVGLQKVLKCG